MSRPHQLMRGRMRCCASSVLSQGDSHTLDGNGKTGRGLRRGDRALHSDLGNSRRCEFVRRLQVMSAFGQTGHRADKAE